MRGSYESPFLQRDRRSSHEMFDLTSGRMSNLDEQEDSATESMAETTGEAKDGYEVKVNRDHIDSDLNKYNRPELEPYSVSNHCLNVQDEYESSLNADVEEDEGTEEEEEDEEEEGYEGEEEKEEEDVDEEDAPIINGLLKSIYAQKNRLSASANDLVFDSDCDSHYQHTSKGHGYESNRDELYDITHGSEKEEKKLEDHQKALDQRRGESLNRLTSAWNEIFERYGKETEDMSTDDEIDLSTGELIVDNGVLRSKNITLFGSLTTLGKEIKQSKKSVLNEINDVRQQLQQQHYRRPKILNNENRVCPSSTSPEHPLQTSEAEGQEGNGVRADFNWSTDDDVNDPTYAPPSKPSKRTSILLKPSLDRKSPDRHHQRQREYSSRARSTKRRSSIEPSCGFDEENEEDLDGQEEDELVLKKDNAEEENILLLYRGVESESDHQTAVNEGEDKDNVYWLIYQGNSEDEEESYEDDKGDRHTGQYTNGCADIGYDAVHVEEYTDEESRSWLHNSYESLVEGEEKKKAAQDSNYSIKDAVWLQDDTVSDRRIVVGHDDEESRFWSQGPTTTEINNNKNDKHRLWLLQSRHKYEADDGDLDSDKENRYQRSRFRTLDIEDDGLDDSKSWFASPSWKKLTIPDAYLLDTDSEHGKSPLTKNKEEDDDDDDGSESEPRFQPQLFPKGSMCQSSSCPLSEPLPLRPRWRHSKMIPQARILANALISKRSLADTTAADTAVTTITTVTTTASTTSAAAAAAAAAATAISGTASNIANRKPRMDVSSSSFKRTFESAYISSFPEIGPRLLFASHPTEPSPSKRRRADMMDFSVSMERSPTGEKYFV